MTTGRETHAKMFKYWYKDELLLSDECFNLAVICPSEMIGGKQNLVIRVVPVPAEKHKVAEFYINKEEQYMISGLKEHIKLIDISTRTTTQRYIGSPTGSNYDMLPEPSNFGKNQLPARTPLKVLYYTKKQQQDLTMYAGSFTSS